MSEREEKSRLDSYFIKNDFKVHSKELKPYYDSLDWLKKGESLFIYGNPGTHKTGQITAICKKMLSLPSYTIRYFRATELIYQKDMDMIHKCSLLIIDNLGYDSDFENRRGCLFDIIDYRLHNFKSTVVITNEDLNKDKKYDLALLDRFNMFHKIQIDGESDRKLNK
jgi:DNA replication protein DnaC